jgi:hypothetical protein
MNAVSCTTLDQARSDRAVWGRLVEACVGAHLVVGTRRRRSSLYYWRQRNLDVDCVVVEDGNATGIEVKSGGDVGWLAGLAAFRAAFGKNVSTMIVGTGGVPLEEFLAEA